MGSSPTGGVKGETTGGRGCRYEWNCANWSECLPSEKQIRNCTNIGTCSDKYKTPQIEKNCTYATSPKVEKEDKKLEKENVSKDEEEPVEISEDESTEEKPIGKHNYIFYAVDLVAVLILGWIYYHQKKK